MPDVSGSFFVSIFCFFLTKGQCSKRQTILSVLAVHRPFYILIFNKHVYTITHPKVCYITHQSVLQNTQVCYKTRQGVLPNTPLHKTHLKLFSNTPQRVVFCGQKGYVILTHFFLECRGMQLYTLQLLLLFVYIM